MKMTKAPLSLMALAVLVALLLVACGGGDAGLSRAEVEEIVREELADAPAPAQPEPGLTSADVEEAIRAAMADMPQPESGLSQEEVERIVESAIRAAIADMPRPEPGLTAAEAERIARGVFASIPPRSAPSEYTKFFVEKAISRYETQGLDATLAYFNRPESIDGQWYVFIIDENDKVIGHPESQRLGLDVRGWVGIDANGYNFGPDMLSATGEGKWVSYVFRNPESGSLGSDHTGALQLKNAWVVKHDGLLFASGWYVNADEFTKALVSAAVAKFRSAGLQATIAYFTGPESVYSGLTAAIEYYNSAENVEGDWFAFIADSGGKVVDHYDKEMVGRDLKDLLGTDMFEATAEGNWVTAEDVRVWVVRDGGMTFGSGWHSGHDEGN